MRLAGCPIEARLLHKKEEPMDMQKSIWPNIAQNGNYSVSRKQLINGYSLWVQERVDDLGWNPFLMTFMFKPSSGNIMIKMANEVTRVYSTFLPRVVRNPRSKFAKDLRPLLLAVPDLPVAKRQKQKLHNVKINNGLHMHAILVVPCKSRLKTDVVAHFKEHESIYVKNQLLRLDVEAIRSRLHNVVDYVFKSVKSEKFNWDDALIFPKASSELP